MSTRTSLIRATLAAALLTVPTLLSLVIPADGQSCIAAGANQCLRVFLDGQEALPSVGFRSIMNDPVSPNPTFRYEFGGDSGLDSLGRVFSSSIGLQRWDSSVGNWVIEYSGTTPPAEPSAILAPGATYSLTALPSQVTLLDYYGARVSGMEFREGVDYRFLFSISADRAATKAVDFRICGTSCAEGPRDSGVQTSPAGGATLIAKRIGEEYWAITHSHGDNDLVGNVYFADGRAPAFLWCAVVDESGEVRFRGKTFRYRCFSAASCESSPCGTGRDWKEVGEVDIKGEFLLPAGTDLPNPPGADDLLPVDLRQEIALRSQQRAHHRLPSESPPTGRESGIQWTPEYDAEILVNKDVAGTRWVITYWDGVINGVAYTAGQEPTFFWCSDATDQQDDMTVGLRCWAAGRCDVAPCYDDLAFAGQVDLPVEFFLAPGEPTLSPTISPSIEGTLSSRR
ncbi:hypothetical protein K2Z84_11220 [Candidatus Binatia bacterium]|nr:hypothetical protein [Candidatus Binatia bacterium]